MRMCTPLKMNLKSKRNKVNYDERRTNYKKCNARMAVPYL